MQKKKTEKIENIVEFQVGDILGLGMTLAVTGIGLAFALGIMGETRDDMTTNSIEYNATTDAMTGVAKIPKKMPTIAGVIVAAIIIGILVRYLWIRGSSE
jgi:hypothetical protein